MLRFQLAVAALIAVYAAAQGCPPATGTSGLYELTPNPCPQSINCIDTYSHCITLGCQNPDNCLTSYLGCLDNVAAPGNCPTLSNLRLSLLNMVFGGQLFNQSSAYSSCVATTCRMYNASGNCTANYTVNCPSPVSTIVTVLFNGSISDIIQVASGSLYSTFTVAITSDLSRAVRFDVSFSSVMALTRPFPLLQLQFQVSGVSAANPILAAELTSLQAAGATWAVSANQVLIAALGHSFQQFGLSFVTSANFGLPVTDAPTSAPNPPPTPPPLPSSTAAPLGPATPPPSPAPSSPAIAFEEKSESFVSIVTAFSKCVWAGNGTACFRRRANFTEVNETWIQRTA